MCGLVFAGLVSAYPWQNMFEKHGTGSLLLARTQQVSKYAIRLRLHNDRIGGLSPGGEMGVRAHLLQVDKKG